MNDPKDSQDDAFSSLLDDAVPIKHDKQTPYRRRRAPVPLPPNPAVTGEDEDQRPVDLQVETGEFLEFQRPGVQNRLFSELQRGHLEPEDAFDLHGLRVHEAREELPRFIQHALQQRMRVVRVIHGKGVNSQGQQPILKQKVNQWLRQFDQVLAFTSAPRFDGGTGATYVLLARKIKPSPDDRY